VSFAAGVAELTGTDVTTSIAGRLWMSIDPVKFSSGPGNWDQVPMEQHVPDMHKFLDWRLLMPKARFVD
jgi:hypothetical protein